MATLDLSLLDWQKECWNSGVRFQVIAAGRRCGKSRYAVSRLLYEATVGDPMADYLYVAPTQKQAKDIAWKLLLNLGNEVVDSVNKNDMEVRLKTGSVIKLRGAEKPETMRGLSVAFAVIDEYADIKPYVWEEIISPALGDREGSVVFIGTPMGRNHFYDLYKSAQLGEDPEFRAWHFTTKDNPKFPKKELEKAEKRLSSYAFRQEYLASFEAKGSVFFHDEWVKYGDRPDEGSYFVAVDLAGFEQTKDRRKKSSRLDETAIVVVLVNQDGWFIEDMICGRWDLDDTAKKIFEVVEKYQPIRVGLEKGIAQQAVISPLQDLMRRTGKFFVLELMTHGNTKKTDRIMWALQGRFENGWVTLKKADWNIKFLDQLFQFPDPFTHDDMVDALSYVDQLSTEVYENLMVYEEDEWEPLDLVAGY